MDEYKTCDPFHVLNRPLFSQAGNNRNNHLLGHLADLTSKLSQIGPISERTIGIQPDIWLFSQPPQPPHPPNVGEPAAWGGGRFADLHDILMMCFFPNDTLWPMG